MARPRSDRPESRSRRPGDGPPRGSRSGGPGRPRSDDRPARSGEGRSDDRRPRSASPRSDDRPARSGEGRSDDRRPRSASPRSDDRPARSGEGRSDDRRPRSASSRSDDRPARSGEGRSDDRRPRSASPRSDDRPARSGFGGSDRPRGASTRPDRSSSDTRRSSTRTAAPRSRGKLLAEQADGPQRLQKILAQAGLASRRNCEMLILEGRVTVDGVVVNELGAKCDPKTAKIAVDGQRIQPEAFVYYLVYKPKGYVSTSNDPSGRPLVMDLVPKAKERLFIVGRLDRFSEGLMLLTNDGALAQHLLHPKFGVEKTYRVTVAGEAGQELIQKLTDGIWLAEGKVRARRARIVSRRGNASVLEIVLAEGKNREIRRMLARLDHKVLSLLRVSIGPLQLKGISEGNWRTLTADEVEQLRNYRPGDERRSADLRSGDRKTIRPASSSSSAAAAASTSEAPAGDRPRSRPDRSERPSGRDERRRPERSGGPSGRSGDTRSRFEERDRPRRDDRRPARRQEPSQSDFDGDGPEEIAFTDRMDFSSPEVKPRRERRPDDRPSSSYSSGPRRRPESGGPDRRGPRPEFRDRPPRGEGSSSEDRPRRSARPDRPPRGEGSSSEDRPRRSARPDRPPRGEGDNRPQRTGLGRSTERPAAPKSRRPGGSVRPRKRK